VCLCACAHAYHMQCMCVSSTVTHLHTHIPKTRTHSDTRAGTSKLARSHTRTHMNTHTQVHTGTRRHTHDSPPTESSLSRLSMSRDTALSCVDGASVGDGALRCVWACERARCLRLACRAAACTCGRRQRWGHDTERVRSVCAGARAFQAHSQVLAPSKQVHWCVHLSSTRASGRALQVCVHWCLCLSHVRAA